MPYKNLSVTVPILAWDAPNGTYKTGDAANFTLRGLGDATEFTPSASAIEVDATNMPGVYRLTLTAGENNYSFVTISGKSATSGIKIIGISWSNEINADVKKWAGTAPTATSQAGTPVVEVTRWLGAAAAAVNVAGTPKVDVVDWNGATAPTVSTEAQIAAAVRDVARAGAAAGSFGEGVNEILTDTGTTLPALLPTALVGGKMDAHVNDIAGNAITAASMAADAGTEIGAAVLTAMNATPPDVNTKTLSNDAITAAKVADDVGTEIATAVWANAARTLTAATGFQVKKNTELAAFPFVMTDSTAHAPAPSVTVTATRSIDGAAFGACANAVAEVANGWYKITLAAGDLNGNTIALRFTATDCDDLNITLITQA